MKLKRCKKGIYASEKRINPNQSAPADLCRNFLLSLYVLFDFVKKVQILPAKPHCSVGSLPDLRTEGHWFDFRLGQYSFQGLMIVIATGLIPLSLLSIVLEMATAI